MFKIKVKMYGNWVVFEKVYGSNEPELFATREEAQKVASERQRIFHNEYRVVEA